jgi:hypothetical protein
MAKKNIKVRDLKPKKDAKGGGAHTLAGGLHHGPSDTSGAGPARGQSGAGPTHTAAGGSPRGGGI